jgi:hypothetical protein
MRRFIPWHRKQAIMREQWVLPVQAAWLLRTRLLYAVRMVNLSHPRIMAGGVRRLFAEAVVTARADMVPVAAMVLPGVADTVLMAAGAVVIHRADLMAAEVVLAAAEAVVVAVLPAAADAVDNAPRNLRSLWHYS